ncbi:MAG: hypothetical protein AB1801_00530 [Chloroflexota bacterium]
MKRILIHLCLLLILGLIGYSLATTPITTASSQWSITTLDDIDPGSYIHHSDTSLAVDDEDTIHVSYRGPNYDLRYATNKNGGWSTEVVYDIAANVARENSIAVDSNDHPHLSFSFSDGGNEDLKYAKNITGTWVITTIDSLGSVGMENDLTVDSNNNIHISHFQWNGARLRYSSNESGIWATTEVITDAGWDRTSIAADSNNHTHIVYRDFSTTRIYYATNLSGIWVITDTEVGGSSPAIALDSNDKVHLSYSSGSELKYATNVSGSWVTVTITSGVTAGRHHSIAVGPQSKVHLSFYDSVEGDLQYANNVTGSWVIYPVDSQGDVGRSNSIAIDSLGFIHISYRDDTNAKLKYATIGPGPVSGVTFTYLPIVLKQ